MEEWSRYTNLRRGREL